MEEDPQRSASRFMSCGSVAARPRRRELQPVDAVVQDDERPRVVFRVLHGQDLEPHAQALEPRRPGVQVTDRERYHRTDAARSGIEIATREGRSTPAGGGVSTVTGGTAEPGGRGKKIQGDGHFAGAHGNLPFPTDG